MDRAIAKAREDRCRSCKHCRQSEVNGTIFFNCYGGNNICQWAVMIERCPLEPRKEEKTNEYI